MLRIVCLCAQVLEEEGAYWLRFFSDTEMPLDPVYYDGKTWAVPAFDTEAEQVPWCALMGVVRSNH